MPFKPGESGNPNGRPKKFTIKDYITEEDVKSLVIKAKELAEQGKTDIVKFLLEQAFGKAPQSIDHTTGGEKLKNYYDELTDEELIKLVESRKRTSEEGTGEKTS